MYVGFSFCFFCRRPLGVARQLKAVRVPQPLGAIGATTSYRQAGPTGPVACGILSTGDIFGLTCRGAGARGQVVVGGEHCLAEQGEAGSGHGRRPLPCQCGSGTTAPVWVSSTSSKQAPCPGASAGVPLSRACQARRGSRRAAVGWLWGCRGSAGGAGMWGARRWLGLGVAVLCVLLRAYQIKRLAEQIAPPPPFPAGTMGGSPFFFLTVWYFFNSTVSRSEHPRHIKQQHPPCSIVLRLDLCTRTTCIVLRFRAPASTRLQT
jgi:hypothetical protein